MDVLEEDVCILETFEKDLKGANFFRQWFLLSVELSAVPEIVKEGFGAQ